MAKLNKGTILPAILLCYTVVMGIFLFPYFKNSGKLTIYACIIGGAVFLSALLAYLFRRQKGKDNQGK